MAVALEARSEGASCDAIIRFGAENLRAQALLVNRFVVVKIAQKRARYSLTNVLDVANDAIVDCVTCLIKFAIVMPVDVSVRVEVFANNCTDDVRTAVDC